MSPTLAFPFVITTSGVSLQGTEVIEVTGQDINSIHGTGIVSYLRLSFKDIFFTYF